MTAMHTATRSPMTSWGSFTGDPRRRGGARRHHPGTDRAQAVRRPRGRGADPTCSGVGVGPRRGPSTSAVASSTCAPARRASATMPAGAGGDALGVGPPQVGDDDDSRPLRTFVLAHHDRAGAGGGRPVDRADRIAVGVLAHAPGEVGAAAREVVLLRGGGAVTGFERAPGGLRSRRDLHRRGQRHPHPAAPARRGRAARR